jgi:hypothetical protein
MKGKNMAISIEILSRYLPWELQAKRDDITYDIVGFTRLGWDVATALRPCMSISELVPVGLLTPILRPFESLVKPMMHNGVEIIPAVEVARMAYGDDASKYEFTIAQVKENIICIDVNDSACMSITINRKYDVAIFEEDGRDFAVENQFLIFRKLLGWQFAVGLEEHEYIRKEE